MEIEFDMKTVFLKSKMYCTHAFVQQIIMKKEEWFTVWLQLRWFLLCHLHKLYGLLLDKIMYFGFLFIYCFFFLFCIQITFTKSIFVLFEFHKSFYFLHVLRMKNCYWNTPTKKMWIKCQLMVASIQKKKNCQIVASVQYFIPNTESDMFSIKSLIITYQK